MADTVPKIFRPRVDRIRRIRNPGRGWCLYVDAFRAVRPEGGPDDSGFPNAHEYWNQMDECGASESADVLYLRVPWSELEPERGRLAWAEDSNFMDLLAGASHRRLRLALRIYVDSHDGYRQATPEYVRQQGARGFKDDPSGLWSPWVDDPVFQELFEGFLSDLAVRFDDPDEVDFVDGQGMGWWGEMHHIPLQAANETGVDAVYRWITKAYAYYFKKILLGIQYGGETAALDDWALGEGAVIRRDSLGSPLWFTNEDKAAITRHWPTVPVFAENCYHHLVTRRNWWQGDGFRSVREVLERVWFDAKEIHSNTLDLRVPEDAATWMHDAPDLVRAFVRDAGYRLAMDEVSLSGKISTSEPATIYHTWTNLGFGKFPGDRHGWQGRYVPAFGFWHGEAQRPTAITLCPKAEPSDWVGDQVFGYTSKIRTPKRAGLYTLVGTLWDRVGGHPSNIQLAHCNPVDGWYRLGRVRVDAPNGCRPGYSR